MAPICEMTDIVALSERPDRHRVDDMIQMQWQRALHAAAPLSLLLIGIDGFRIYNNQYGHLAGGDVLRKVVGTLCGMLQHAGDRPACYGDEEFVAILPGATVEQACFVAESLRIAIRRLAIPHADTVAGMLTVSVGCAGLKDVSDSTGFGPLDLLRSAEAALYRARRDGRDRIALQSDDLPPGIALQETSPTVNLTQGAIRR